MRSTPPMLSTMLRSRTRYSRRPAAVILSMLAGGILAGFAGALLALPIAATIKVIAVDVILASRSNPHPTTRPRRIHPHASS